MEDPGSRRIRQGSGRSWQWKVPAVESPGSGKSWQWKDPVG